VNSLATEQAYTVRMSTEQLSTEHPYTEQMSIGIRMYTTVRLYRGRPGVRSDAAVDTMPPYP